jgi:hypothetical protein
MGAPAVAWQYYVQAVDPIWAAKYLSPKLSPPLSGYLLGYGLVLLAALIGAVYALRQRRALVPVVWLVLGFALVYAPVNFQRKLAEGLQLPLCLLAALALGSLFPLSRKPTPRGQERGAGGEASPRNPLPCKGRGQGAGLRLAVALFLAVTVPSNLYYVADGLARAHLNTAALAVMFYPPAYLTDDELAGLRWLGAHASARDVVLASPQMGNYIPTAAPCHVVAGHWDETVHPGKYLALVDSFFTPSATPAARRATLAQARADLVFYGPQERNLQRALQEPAGPAAADPAPGVPELREVFRQGEVVIYAVQGRRG